MELAMSGKSFAEIQELLGTELPETIGAMFELTKKLKKFPKI